MKIYLVKRIGAVELDSSDSFVIVAESVVEAQILANNELREELRDENVWEVLDTKVVDMSEAHIVLKSFNAG